MISKTQSKLKVNPRLEVNYCPLQTHTYNTIEKKKTQQEEAACLMSDESFIREFAI